MQIGPRYKICKRLGSEVFAKCQTQKFEVSKSRGHKNRRRRRLSNYGEQLLEKQKVRFTYGMSEKQFRRYVDESTKSRGEKPTASLYARLESRLDNVVYRMGLARSRRMARQLVSHGHINVNDSRVNIPSYQVSEGDKISIRERSREKEPFLNLEERQEGYTPPAWLLFDPQKKQGEVEGTPVLDTTTADFDLTSVIEFYSR